MAGAQSLDFTVFIYLYLQVLVRLNGASIMFNIRHFVKVIFCDYVISLLQYHLLM